MLIFIAVDVLLFILVSHLTPKQRRKFEIYFATFFIIIRVITNAVVAVLDENMRLFMIIPFHLCTLISISQAVAFFYIDKPFEKTIYFFVFYMRFYGFRLQKNALGIMTWYYDDLVVLICVFDVLCKSSNRLKFPIPRSSPCVKTIVGTLGAFPIYTFTFIGIAIVVLPIYHYTYFGIVNIYNNIMHAHDDHSCFLVFLYPK